MERVIVRWMLAGLFGGLVLAVTLATLSGSQSLTVMSGSMEPAISTGDVVLTKLIAPAAARVGDVVTYKEPDAPGRLITHRIRSIRVQGRSYAFVTKGDANDGVERWKVAANGKIARVTHHAPQLGYVLAHLRDPAKRLWILVIPAVLLGLFELVRIWRPSSERVVVDEPA
jgi:signal peptidase I